ncbi:winged helix-turn-helix domain-containing protein [Methylomagnum sp.]
MGAAAGKIWEFLSGNGPASASRLAEGAGLDKHDVQRGLGWLAREGKLSVERKGKNEFFSLIQE